MSRKYVLLPFASIALLVLATWATADIPAGYNYNQHDADNVIDTDDYDDLVEYINTYTYVTSSSPNYVARYDVTGNGVIYSFDALQWSNFWNSAPWQNHSNPYDVNNADGVTTADALAIANEINANGEHYFEQDDANEAPYYDVDGDNQVTENDFNAVVDYLN